MQHGGRVARAVVGYRDPQCFSCAHRGKLHLHGAGVVAGRIVQQVFHCAGQQRGVRVQNRLVGVGCNFQRHRAAGRQRAVTELGGQPAQQRSGLGRLAAQRLCAVLQLAGQVQILDQSAQLLALGADAARLLPRRGGQGGVLLELLGPAQNQRQRCAHIMADPRDPACAGIVPPGDDLIAAAQLLTRAVDRVGQLPRKTVCRQPDRTAIGYGGQSCGNRLQAPRTAPAEQQTTCSWHTQQQRQRGQHTRCHGVHKLRIVVNIAPPDRTARHGGHKQAVVCRPAEHRPVVKIPPRERGDFRRCVVFIQVLRQVMLPDHTAVVVQHHRPGVALQPVRGRAGGVQLQAVGCRDQGLCQRTDADAAVRGLAVVQPQIDHRPQQQTHHQQHHRRRGQHIAPDHSCKGFQLHTSPVSR